jgi:hypothetical protein
MCESARWLDASGKSGLPEYRLGYETMSADRQFRVVAR